MFWCMLVCVDLAVLCRYAQLQSRALTVGKQGYGAIPCKLTDLQKPHKADLKSAGRKAVGVQVPLRAPPSNPTTLRVAYSSHVLA